MRIKIELTKPPQWIWEECHEKFEIDDPVTIYTYGDVLHNPFDVGLSVPTIVHEETHMDQQAAYPGGPDAWWQKYFEDKDFRLSQEVAAYGNQYREFCKSNRDRNVQVRYLAKLAEIAASPMYSFDITYYHAMHLIKFSPKQ